MCSLLELALQLGLELVWRRRDVLRRAWELRAGWGPRHRSFCFWTLTLVSESWVSKTPPAARLEVAFLIRVVRVGDDPATSEC